jgi:hypothetical protein
LIKYILVDSHGTELAKFESRELAEKVFVYAILFREIRIIEKAE